MNVETKRIVRRRRDVGFTILESIVVLLVIFVMSWLLVGLWLKDHNEGGSSVEAHSSAGV